MHPSTGEPITPQAIIFRANMAAPNSKAEPTATRLVIRRRRGSIADDALTGSTIGLKN